MELKRNRYVIMRENRTEIFCGLAQNYKFKKIEELKNTPVKTYGSSKIAHNSFLSSWRNIDFDWEVVSVCEVLTWEE